MVYETQECIIFAYKSRGFDTQYSILYLKLSLRHLSRHVPKIYFHSPANNILPQKVNINGSICCDLKPGTFMTNNNLSCCILGGFKIGGFLNGVELIQGESVNNRTTASSLYEVNRLAWTAV